MPPAPAIRAVTLPEGLVPSAMEQAAARAIATLRQAGYQAYYAGGFARDVLLGRPVHDIDLATNAVPASVETLFPGSRSFGKSFGVVQIEVDGFHFETATFRSEGPYRDGRHPESVSFTTEDEDAQRRDFTINGMFYDPGRHAVVDYVGGLEDLNHRTLRAIGDPARRFAEDHLRILRAVRFSSVLEFTIEPVTLEAIRRLAGELRHISVERIRDELIRMLMEAPRPGAALTLLRDTGILAVILPEAQAMHGVPQPPEFHPEGDVFTHVCLMLDRMQERSPELVWSILMHDIAKPTTYAVLPDKTGKPRIRFFGHAEQGAQMAEEIMRRFRCPNDLIEAVATAVRHHMRFASVPEMKSSTLRKWVGAPTFPLELELHRIDCLSSHGSLDHFEQIKAFRDTLAAEPALPPPLVRGQDLLRRGIPGGPEMGRLLRAAYDQQLEGAFHDETTAAAWLDANLAALRRHGSSDVQP